MHESRLPDFGRPWTANGLYQVNFRPTPENFGVWQFKLAMWEVGVIKIERNTSLQHFFYVYAQKLAKKGFFWQNTLYPKISVSVLIP